LILKLIDSRRMKIGQMALKSAECAVPEINGIHPLIIGGGGIIRSLERYFTGGIAEVRIWNRERESGYIIRHRSGGVCQGHIQCNRRGSSHVFL
jgi:glutamyl-tRNA reductase